MMNRSADALLNKNNEIRVLLVDDHRLNADLVDSMLCGEPGLTLEYQQDPLRALETALAFAPSVIMVDLHMPMVDGLEVIRALKQDARVAAVPIIMLSSNTSPQVKASGFEAGAIDYLVKWPDRVELTARLQAHSRAYRAMQERDRATEALRTSQAELFERTRELADAQASLHAAEKMEAIGQLTSGVAHDFNNVLQLINGHLQLLRMAHRADERTVRRLDAASEGVRRGAQLAAQMLAFARRQPLAPVTIDVGTHLRSMEHTIRQTLDGRALELALASGLTTMVDPLQFEKTVLHLVQNAAEAMGDDGRLQIAADLAQLPGEPDAAAPPRHIRLRLTDDGAGMTEEVQRRAFEPFFSTKTGNRGAGLGLSLVFGFVKQSGGQLELASTPGGGTTVAVYFPLLLSGDADVAAHTAPTAVEHARTVLVVEDEASVRQVSVEVLRKLGLCVLEAADGETALGMIRQRLPIDLVFTDMLMPGEVRGQDLATAAAEHLPRAKVLFASGYAGQVGAAGAERVHLLNKPYRLDEMSRRVQQLLAEE